MDAARFTRLLQYASGHPDGATASDCRAICEEAEAWFNEITATVETLQATLVKDNQLHEQTIAASNEASRAWTAELSFWMDEARTWKERYFSAGRSEDAFAADMARLTVAVFKNEENARRERDRLMAICAPGIPLDRARIISLLFDKHEYSPRRGLWFPTGSNLWIDALDNPKRMHARWIRIADGKVEMVSFAGSEDALYTTEV